MTTRPGRHRIQSPAQGRNAERVQPDVSRPDIDRHDRRSANGFTRRRFLTGAGMVGAAAFSGELLTSQVANAAADRRRLVDAVMPVAPQPVSKTLVGFAANGREADFSHLLGLGVPVQ